MFIWDLGRSEKRGWSGCSTSLVKFISCSVVGFKVLDLVDYGLIRTPRFVVVVRGYLLNRFLYGQCSDAPY